MLKKVLGKQTVPDRTQRTLHNTYNTPSSLQRSDLVQKNPQLNSWQFMKLKGRGGNVEPVCSMERILLQSLRHAGTQLWLS
jgi:hypothetical protein